MELMITGDRLDLTVDQYVNRCRSARLKNPSLMTIHIGDFGFKKSYTDFEEDRHDMDFILMGNHDYYPFADKEYVLGDSGYIYQADTFFMRGAKSIDSAHRTPGYDYFTDEELSPQAIIQAQGEYAAHKPSIMLSHDAPAEVVREMFGYWNHSITRKTLQTLFDIHQPNIWIFGHHHTNKVLHLNGTTFICLGEDQSIFI